MTDADDWTVVTSSETKRVQKNLQKDIKLKIEETKIIIKYDNILICKKNDAFNKKYVINPDILNDSYFLNYIKKRFIFNRDRFNNNRLVKIYANNIKNISEYFMKLPISLDNYNLILFPEYIETINNDIKMSKLKIMYKINHTNDSDHTMVIVYETDNVILPYSIVKYDENKNNLEKCILFSNYYELILYLYNLELKLDIRKSVLCNYPPNFDDINSSSLSIYFSNYNKLWK